MSGYVSGGVSRGIAREEAFGLLEELGIAVVHVPYNGAHDESFVESSRLYASDPEGAGEEPKYVLGEELVFGRVGREGAGLGAREEDNLREALEKPIYEELGEAFGDGADGVDGVAIWRVAERKVVIEHGYLDWHTEEIEAWERGVHGRYEADDG